MHIYLATTSRHKVVEVARILAGTQVSLRPVADLGGMPEVTETGHTFLDNARLKAKALVRRIPRSAWVLADDSGLVVDALGGAPGVRSARYAGEQASDWENNDKLLYALAGVSGPRRTARFCCYLVLLNHHGTEHTFSGTCEGRIAGALVGRSGFGYDPLFIPAGYQQTLAELGPAIKDYLSHRARALGAFKEQLAALESAGL